MAPSFIRQKGGPMPDDNSPGGRDLIKERENAASITRGLINAIGLSLALWTIVGLIAWRVAHAIISALS